MYKSIRRFALGGSVVVASVLVVTLTSVAAKVAKVETESYKNVATGLCLESNGARQVYTQGCNGSSYQKWTVGAAGSALVFRNVATGLCLESNGARQVYTQGCNGSSYQKWRSLDVRATPVSSLS